MDKPPCFPPFIIKGNNFYDFLFAFFWRTKSFKLRPPLKKEFAPSGAVFFPLELTPIDKAGKNENDRVASAKVKPFTLTSSYLENPYKAHRQTVQTQVRYHIMWRLIRVYGIRLQDFPPKIIRVFSDFKAVLYILIGGILAANQNI